MKRIATLIIAFLSILCFSTEINAQNFKVDGKTIISQKTEKTSSSDVLTTWSYEDSKGESYQIYLHKYTRGENIGKYTCYIIKTSKKTGKPYKQYLKDGIEMANQIISEDKSIKLP